MREVETAIFVPTAAIQDVAASARDITDTIGAVAGALWDVQPLCGLLHPLCGLSSLYVE